MDNAQFGCDIFISLINAEESFAFFTSFAKFSGKMRKIYYNRAPRANNKGSKDFLRRKGFMKIARS
jgi:hypothetical protein